MTVPPLDEVALLDRRLDLGPDGGPLVLDPGLEQVVAALSGLSAAIWEEERLALVPAPTAPAPEPVRPAPATPPPRSSPLGRRPFALAGAAAVALAVVLVLALLSGTAPQGGARSRPWRLAGFLSPPAWAAVPAGPTGVSVSLACATPLACLATATGAPGGAAVVAATSDGGATWTTTVLPAGTWVTSAPACTDASDCVLGAVTGVPAGAQTPAGGTPVVLATTDAGATWAPRTLPAGTGLVTDLACDPAGCTGADVSPTGGGSAALVSPDGGTTWAPAALPAGFVPATPGALACSASDCVLGGSLVAGSGTAAAAVSTDGGAHWVLGAVPAGPVGLRAVSCPSAGRCVALASDPSAAGPALGRSGVLVSVDGGRHWSAPAGTGLPGADLMALSCPAAADCVAAGTDLTAAGGPRAVLAETTDGGGSWRTAVLPGGLLQAVTGVACPAPGACRAVASRPGLGQQGSVQVVLAQSAGS
jgi:hypothetical protein